MNPSLRKQLLKTFAQMINDLENPKEIEIFLRDFFNKDELEKYVRRISSVYWLKKGRDEENITRNLSATSREIKLAREILKKDGVKLAIKKIEAEEWANVWSEKIKNFTKINK